MKFPFRSEKCLRLIYLLAVANCSDIKGNALVFNSSSAVEMEISAVDDFQIDEGALLSVDSMTKKAHNEPDDYLKSVLSGSELEIIRNGILISSNARILSEEITPASIKLTRDSSETTAIADTDNCEADFDELKLAHDIILQELNYLRGQVKDLTESLNEVTQQDITLLAEPIELDVSKCQAKLVDGQLLSNLMIENFKLETELRQKKYDAHIFDLTSKLGYCAPEEKLQISNTLEAVGEEAVVKIQERNAAVTLISFLVFKYIEFLSAIPVFYVINRCGHFGFESYISMQNYSLLGLERCRLFYDETVLPYYYSEVQPSMNILYDKYMIPIYKEVLLKCNTVYSTVPPFTYSVYISGQLYYSDHIQPQIRSLYMIHISKNWDEIIVPPCQTLKLYFCEIILPKVEDFYTNYILGNWDKYIKLPFMAHVEPHLIILYGHAEVFYFTYLQDKVKLYVEPLFDYMWNKLNRVAYNIHRYCDRDDFYERLLEDVTNFYFVAVETYTSFVSYIQSNSVGKLLLGKYTREGASMIFCTAVFVGLILLRRIIMGILAICLFLVLTPLLPIVYVLSKIRRLFIRKLVTKKSRGKVTVIEEKKKLKSNSISPLDTEIPRGLTLELPSPAQSGRRGSIKSRDTPLIQVLPTIVVSPRKSNLYTPTGSPRYKKKEPDVMNTKNLNSCADEISRPSAVYDDYA